MIYLCLYCMNDVGSSLLEYSLDIVTSPDSIEIPCPRCSQTIEVRVPIRFDLRRQAVPEELASQTAASLPRFEIFPPEASISQEARETWLEHKRRKGFDHRSPSERRSSNGRRRSAR